MKNARFYDGSNIDEEVVKNVRNGESLLLPNKYCIRAKKEKLKKKVYELSNEAFALYYRE